MASFNLVPLADSPVDPLVLDAVASRWGGPQPVADLGPMADSEFFVLRATEPLPEYGIKAGDWGGVVEGRETLKPGGHGWISAGSIVVRGSTIDANAFVGPGMTIVASALRGEVSTLGRGLISGSVLEGPITIGHAETICDNSYLTGPLVSEGMHLTILDSYVKIDEYNPTDGIVLSGECNLRKSDTAGAVTIRDSVLDVVRMEGKATVAGAHVRNAQVLDDSYVAGDVGPGATIAGKARILANASVRDGARVSQDAIVAGRVVGPADVSGHSYVGTEGRIDGPVTITDHVTVEGCLAGLVTATDRVVIDRLAHVKTPSDDVEHQIRLSGSSVIHGDLEGPADIDSDYYGATDASPEMTPEAIIDEEEPSKPLLEASSAVGEAHGPQV